MATETPVYAALPAQQVASIHVLTPRNEIQSAMQAALQEISAVLRDQQLALTGPWFAHHYRRPTDTFDFDVCFPTASPVTPSGRVQPAQTEACEVIRTVHTGFYDGLHTAWREFGDWIDAQQLPIRGDLFEVYVSGPRENPDPTHWRTEMNYPLAAKPAAG